MHARKVLILLALLSAMVAWLLLWDPPGRGQAPARGEPTRPEEETPGPLIPQLQSDIALLKEQQAQLWQRCAARAATAPGQTQRQSALTSEAAPRPDAEVHQDAARALDQHLQAEARDPRWSEQAEQEIAQALKAKGQVSLKLYHVECQTSLCRVELSSGTIEEREQLLDSLSRPTSLSGGVFVHHLDEDPRALRTVVYLSRQGHSLPTVFH